MAWLLAASVTVTSLSAGTVTAYAQEEMPLAEAGTVTESAEDVYSKIKVPQIGK